MMKSSFRKKSWDYDLIAMSFHESGHIVCAIYNYSSVYNANVMTPKIRDGNTDFYSYGNNLIEDEDLNKIMIILELQILYAGLISEKMYYKDICGSSKFPMHLKIGSSWDTQQASIIFRKNNLAPSGKRTLLLKKSIQNDVEHILSEHWDAVKMIAHSLYMKKRLTFDEIKFILTRKTQHNDFWKNKFKKIKLIHNESSMLTEYDIKKIMLDNAILSFDGSRR